MSTISGSGVEENHLGIKFKGDLGDIQIVEEISESEEEDDIGIESSRAVSTISTLQQDLVKPTIPVFGNVSVANSENVQIGNNTFFNGPVTIKQVVANNFENDNPGYEHTEETTTQYTSPKTNSKVHYDSYFQKLEIKLWLKVTFSAVCFIVIGGICAILSITLSNQAQKNGSPVFNDEEKASQYWKVEGICYNIQNLNVFLAVMVLLLTFMVTGYWYLTNERGAGEGGDCEVIYGQLKTKNNNYDKSYDAEDDPLLIAPNHLRIVSRTNWLAKPIQKPLDKLRLPAPWVIIAHTDTEGCFTQSECVLRVRLIQMFHMESRGWFDIGYNFLLAGDGSAYFGRGWDYQGAHTLGYNKYSIGIAFIGAFDTTPPPKKQLEACQKLIEQGVQLGKIAKDYKLFGHRQLMSSLSPGDKLYNIIKEWPHFVKNGTSIEDIVPKY